MPHRKSTLSRLAVASLLAAAVSAPAAMATPAGDMPVHVSTVHKPTPGSEHLRSEGAMAQSILPQTKASVSADLRSEGAKDRTRAPQRTALRPGAPTWPEHPKVLAPPAQTVASDGRDGIEVDWPAIVLVLAGTLALGGGLGAAGQRLRTAQPPPAH